MPSEPSVRVENIEVNQRALKACGDLDLERAGTEGGRNLIPYIQAETRVETGTMRDAWMADNGAFVNNVEYSPFQEFGTIYVEGTFAIRKAIDKGEEVLLKAFEKESERATKKAGLSS